MSLLNATLPFFLIACVPIFCLVCLACAALGNTRPIFPGLAAAIVAFPGSWWLASQVLSFGKPQPEPITQLGIQLGVPALVFLAFLSRSIIRKAVTYSVSSSIRPLLLLPPMLLAAFMARGANFFHLLCVASLPTAFFFCQATAASGNTRPVRPALWSGGVGVALTVSASLMEPYFPGKPFYLLLALLLPVLVFAVFLALSICKKTPVVPIASGVRWALSVLPLLGVLALDSDAAGVLGFVLLTGAAALSLFCATMGRVPALMPLFVAGLTALNIATLLYLLRDLFDMPSLLFFVAAFLPAAVPAWRQYRALPADGRLRGRVPGDVRWILGMFAVVFLVLCLMPGRMGEGSAALLPPPVMTALACAVMGNTRAVRPGVFAEGTALLFLVWISTLGSIGAATGGILLLVLLAAPAVVFALGLFAMVSEKVKTLLIPVPARIFLGAAGAAGLMGFVRILFR